MTVRSFLRNLAAVLFAFAALAAANAAEFSFATVEQGRALISARDDYITRLSALERSLKAKSPMAVSEQAFIGVLASGVQPWSDGDRSALEQALATMRPQLDALRLPLPDQVVFVRTSGVGEGGASHTRGDAVMLTDDAFREPGLLRHVVAHELFHVASRKDRRWRDAMYATIGFVAIDEITLPPPLAERRITNPDAPRIDVALNVGERGQTQWVTPVLQATVDRYDPARGGEFFTSLQLLWLEIGRGDAAPAGAQLSDPPRLLRTQELVNFAQQVGRNTGYIIHPEEILADNFAQLVTGQAPRSPEVHERLRRALREYPR